MKEKRALIVFVRLPRVGEVKTRLGGRIGMREAAAAYKHFAQHAFELADDLESIRVEVYVFYAPEAKEEEIRAWIQRPFIYVQQEGRTLGARMQRAFDTTFARGSLRTVIIGTDVPELDAHTLRFAYSRLSSHDVVLGPSSDGGYYLLGMNAPTKNLFDGIEWSTVNVLQQTLSCAERLRLSYTLLPEFADIDTEEDFKKYLERTK
jgi:rSAM/selenodomain-associated transferase 1